MSIQILTRDINQREICRTRAKAMAFIQGRPNFFPLLGGRERVKSNANASMCEKKRSKDILTSSREALSDMRRRTNGLTISFLPERAKQHLFFTVAES